MSWSKRSFEVFLKEKYNCDNYKSIRNNKKYLSWSDYAEVTNQLNTTRRTNPVTVYANSYVTEKPSSNWKAESINDIKRSKSS